MLLATEFDYSNVGLKNNWISLTNNIENYLDLYFVRQGYNAQADTHDHRAVVEEAFMQFILVTKFSKKFFQWTLGKEGSKEDLMSWRGILQVRDGRTSDGRKQYIHI